MKNKIQKFSKGDFQHIGADIVFDETNLVLIIGEGELYRGSFHIKSRQERQIRGLVYSSSFRIKFKNQGFEGNPAKVEFTYDGRNLLPGHVEEGTLHVVCDGGEYDLSFTAIIEKPYVLTTYGKVQSTDDFRKLAIKDFNEAVRLFRSRSFYEILKYENTRIFHLYDNMRKWELDDQAMEEFLVGIKQKECIFLTLPGEGMLFEDLTESAKGTINLIKNTWGYMPIRIETEGDFIRVTRPNISTEDFIGNSYEFEYFVQPEFLHAGRNFGLIKFVTPYETLRYEVEVLQSQEYDENHRKGDLYKAQMLKEYIGYIAGRVELNTWIDGAVSKMEQLCKLEPNNDIYQLLHANIYLLGDRVNEAKLILENYNYNRFSLSKDAITNCYYLYLTAIIRGDENNMHRALEEIQKTYDKNPDSFLMLSMILNLDNRFRSPYKRMELLESYFQNGNHEVLFYLEVYLCYHEKPVLLRKLGILEKQVLNFATKYRLMDRELSLHVANFSSQLKRFDPQIFRILERLYQMYEDPMILNAICTILIKGNKVEQRYFPWYKKAVEAELKIAQLYEFYMITLDEKTVQEPLPKSILLYFMHGNNLDYRRTAILYANLVTYEKQAGDLYLGYQDRMEEFTWDQLLKRHISDSLRILYKRFCHEEDMTPERIEALRDICYSYSINTKVKGMNLVLIIEKDGKIRQRIPYDTQKGAVICLYDKESRIVWESLEGHHYTDSIVYETDRLFFEPRFIDICNNYEQSKEGNLEENKKHKLTFDGIYRNGMEAYEDMDLLRLCSNRIREENYKEDDFLTAVCYKLFEKKQYDNITLTYLANYYCGPTRNMKHVWNLLKENEITSYKIAERIITQMVFSESTYQEEPVFEDYYLSDNVYFRLKQAYLAYVSREYVLYDRELLSSVFEIIVHECRKGEDLADVCKIALLKYYSCHEIPENYEEAVHTVLREQCERQIIFPFYLGFREEWLRELLLYDKTMISYQAKPGNRVMLFYKKKISGNDELGYRSEIMLPVYENIFVRQFILFQGESINYYIQELSDSEKKSTEKCILENTREIPGIGKFGRLNRMQELSVEEQHIEKVNYLAESMLADDIFKTY